ncbi:hypothetical protein P9112_003827 [Eukaryota sp. TZLM1-RC]
MTTVHHSLLLSDSSIVYATCKLSIRNLITLGYGRPLFSKYSNDFALSAYNCVPCFCQCDELTKLPARGLYPDTQQWISSLNAPWLKHHTHNSNKAAQVITLDRSHITEQLPINPLLSTPSPYVLFYEESLYLARSHSATLYDPHSLTPLSPPLSSSFPLYKTLRSNGYVVRAGGAMGCNYLLYTDLPSKVHSVAGVTDLEGQEKKWLEVLTLQRVCNSLRKTLVLNQGNLFCKVSRFKK